MHCRSGRPRGRFGGLLLLAAAFSFREREPPQREWTRLERLKSRTIRRERRASIRENPFSASIPMLKQSWLALCLLIALLGSGGMLSVPTTTPSVAPIIVVDSKAMQSETPTSNSIAAPTPVAPIASPTTEHVVRPSFGFGDSPYGPGSGGSTYSPSTVMPDVAPRIPPTGFGGPVVGSGGRGLSIPR